MITVGCATAIIIRVMLRSLVGAMITAESKRIKGLPHPVAIPRRGDDHPLDQGNLGSCTGCDPS